MRCNTDVSGSKHLIRWHLSDTKSLPSLDASRMKLRPLQVEVEQSGFKKLLNTLVDFRLTSFRQFFLYFFDAVDARQALAAVVMLLRLQGA